MQSFLEFSCRLHHFGKHMFICRQATTFDLYRHFFIQVFSQIQSPIAKFYSCASPLENGMFVCLAYNKNVFLLRRPNKSAFRMSHLLCFIHSYVAPVVMTSSFAFQHGLLGDYTSCSCASPLENRMFVYLTYKKYPFLLRRPKQLAIRLSHLVCIRYSYATSTRSVLFFYLAQKSCHSSVSLGMHQAFICHI